MIDLGNKINMIIDRLVRASPAFSSEGGAMRKLLNSKFYIINPSNNNVGHYLPVPGGWNKYIVIQYLHLLICS